ncbi:MAG: ABC transporter ATP-binding protein [Methanomassiliicoccales archaeon]
MGSIIEIEGLCKSYGRRGEIRALEDLCLDIEEGETFGLLGPNGSGKTTTVRLLNGIISPTSGTARVAGKDIVTQREQVKRSTGLLAESPGLYEKLTPWEFLEFVGALYGVPKETISRRAEDLLDLFGLRSRSDYLLEGFSRGMKQKVLIAAALIHDPPVLFLDEPTSTLDPRASHVVKDLMKDLSKRAGKTIFVCSHILPVVEEICDRIGVINDGKLVAVGRVEEIVEQAETNDLEEAFIALTGGERIGKLLEWGNGP